MIRHYILEDGRLALVPEGSGTRDDIIWTDLLQPTLEEETAVEDALKIDVPTREEMEEIEISSRLYSAGGTHFMTAMIPANTEDDRAQEGSVTFVLAEKRLVTIRYHEPSSFPTFAARAEKTGLGCTGVQSVLVALLETVVDRIADVLERVGREIGELSERIFHPSAAKISRRDRDFQAILRRIGRKEELLSTLQDSLHTLQRVSSYLAYVTNGEKDTRLRLKTLSRDISSLGDYGSKLSSKITFLLDATLGMISIEQNAIIKIVSVLATIFMPPTLVASIYGMNFDVMPELQWIWGYPLAIAIMAAAAALPFWYIKKKGWL